MLHGSVEGLASHPSRSRRRVEARAALELALRVGDLVVVPVSAILSHVLFYGSAAPDPSQRVVFGAVLLSAMVCFMIGPVYRGWRGRALVVDL